MFNFNQIYVGMLKNAGRISAVKLPAALNHAGDANMKPRQLSGAIHEEVG